MISSVLMAAFLMGSYPANQVSVDVGRADWKTLPALKPVTRPLPTPALVEKVETMLASGKCRMKGQSAAKFDITVPYAVLLNPDGTTTHVIVAETGCAELESLVGLVVLQLAEEGEFRASRSERPRWLASSLNFNLE